MKCWLGIDCGSVSVKLALIDKDDKLIDSIYLKNRGITETVQKGLVSLNNSNYDVQGVCVTGSGRQFLSLLVGADLIKTEILAHTIATMKYYPEVQTIMDIGGEDCKIMEVEDGVLTNFIMNNICGAGTGAMIESIASRLEIPIEEVGDLALTSKNRLDFPGKCGIFCQSAVVSKLNSGARKNDIMRGVIRALTSNYLTLARGIRLNPPYVFQGATAQNKAVVKSLEEELGHEVTVPEHCALMGAIGCAMMVKEAEIQKTRFKGFNVSTSEYKSRSFKCDDCPNLCEITQLYDGNRFIGGVGSRCGKWDDNKFEKKKGKEIVATT